MHDYECSKCGYEGDSVDLAPEGSEYERLCPQCEEEERTEESYDEIGRRENAVLDAQEREYMRRQW